MRNLIVMSAIGLLTVACSNDEGSSRKLPDVPELEFDVTFSVDIGSGMISPFRIEQDGEASDRLLVVTGRGETYPEARLHRIDAVTFEDVADPIELGANASDIVVLGPRILVAVRGSEKIVLVDGTSWRIEAELPLGFPPGSLAVTGPDEVVVASAATSDITWIKLTNEGIEVTKSRKMFDFAYALAADPAEDRVYAVEPNFGIQTFEGQSSLRDLVSLPGEPGRGATLWHNYLVVSNRDGFLHFIDRANHQVVSLDIATVLGLDRSALPARGIDPGDVVAIDDDMLLLVNARQDSVLFAFEPGASDIVKTLARLPGGANGFYEPSARRILITQPSVNAITDITLPPAITPGEQLTGRRRTTGSEIEAAQIFAAGSPLAAVLLSNGTIETIAPDGSIAATLSPESGETWRPPLLIANDQLVVLARRPGVTDSLLVMDASGAVLARWPISLASVFSGAERGGAIILVSRVNHRVELLDLATGSSRVLTLQSDRPRVALGFDDDVWIVAHDTTPDIGLTVIRNGQEVRGESFDDWFAALAPLDSSHALAASFNGALSVVDSDGTIGQVERTRLFSVSDVAVESPAAAWVVSENLGAAHRVELPSLEVQSRVYSQGLRFLERARSEGELLAIGARRVQLVQAPAGDQPTQ